MTRTTSEHEDRDPRFWCFDDPAKEQAFEKTLMALVAQMQKQSRQTFVNEQNFLRLNHGGRWVHSASECDSDTSMQTISAETSIPFQDIADNDLTLIARTIMPMNEEMDRQFAKFLYGVVGAAAEKVGNVVNAQKGDSISLSMLEIFRKIDFGVDRNGNVTLPQIHVGSEMFERIKKEMDDVPAEISAQIEQVKAEKTRDALAKEAERRAKFKRAFQ